jgi:hypothetical protein
VNSIIPYDTSHNHPGSLCELRASYDLEIRVHSVLLEVYKLVSKPYVRAMCAVPVSFIDVLTQLPSLS